MTSQRPIVLRRVDSTVPAATPAVPALARLPQDPDADAFRGHSSRGLSWESTEEIHDRAEQIGTAVVDEPTPPPSVEELKVAMLDQNYCSHQIDYLAQVYDIPALCEFAKIDRRVARPEDHTPCLGKTQCIAFNSALDAGYQIRHAAHCTRESCYIVETPQDELLNVVRSGGVPLISIKESSGGHLSLRVSKRKFQTVYATISHVCADGLGNPNQNALPACQIKYLQSLLDWLAKNEERFHAEGKRFEQYLDDWFLKGKVKIWMDTLCIPLGSAHQRLRDQCIDTMASIYASSCPVFVLDKELMKTPLDHESSQPLYQIACSVWMCRSWTLQEAILPQACVFQFSDELYWPRKDDVDYKDDLAEREITKSIFDDFLEIRKRGPGGFDMEEFLSVWNGLAGRGTTKSDDLWVVLASCLDIKLRQFRRFKSMEERMQRIVFSFETLPFSLFCNAGPRLDADGNHNNRWVPTRVSRFLLRNGSTFKLPGPKASNYSNHGMRLELSLESDVIVLLVDFAMPKVQDYVLVQDYNRFQIHAVLDASDQFQTGGCVATCVVIESDIMTSQSTFRGACFYITTSQDQPEVGTTGICLEMIYFCPVFATRSNPSQCLERTKHENEFAARSLDQHCKYFVKFKPVPGFKPLNRNRWHWFWSSIDVFWTVNMIMSVCGGAAFSFWVAFYAPAWLTDEVPGHPNIPAIAGGISAVPVLFVVPLMISFVAVRLSNYIFLYQSYDDNTVVNKLGRLVAVIAMATVFAMQSTWQKLFDKISRKRNSRAAIDFEDTES